MYWYIQYCRHLLTATNQYGVHSPFVYNYLTKCLYTKSKYRGSKSQKVVLKSIQYFAFTQIKINAKDLRLKNHIQKEFNFELNKQPAFDFIYFDKPPNDFLLIQKEKTHNDSMVLIHDIHKSKNTTALWEELVKTEAVTVSLDMFYCGVLFFRKEQVKEHFKIRI